MSKDKLFAYYLEKNPVLVKQLKDGKVSLTANGFKKFFNSTYEAAYNQGIYDVSNNDTFEHEDSTQYRRPESNQAALNELLGIFGMK